MRPVSTLIAILVFTGMAYSFPDNRRDSEIIKSTETENLQKTITEVPIEGIHDVKTPSMDEIMKPIVDDIIKTKTKHRLMNKKENETVDNRKKTELLNKEPVVKELPEVLGTDELPLKPVENKKEHDLNGLENEKIKKDSEEKHKVYTNIEEISNKETEKVTKEVDKEDIDKDKDLKEPQKVLETIDQKNKNVHEIDNITDDPKNDMNVEEVGVQDSMSSTEIPNMQEADTIKPIKIESDKKQEKITEDPDMNKPKKEYDVKDSLINMNKAEDEIQVKEPEKVIDAKEDMKEVLNMSKPNKDIELTESEIDMDKKESQKEPSVQEQENTPGIQQPQDEIKSEENPAKDMKKDCLESNDQIQWEPNYTSFISNGTDAITSAIWKSCEMSKCEEEELFSPLGYHMMLTMMAEGARGDTRHELEQLLHLPEDDITVRSAYQRFIHSFKKSICESSTGTNFQMSTEVYADVKAFPMDKQFQDALKYYNATLKTVPLQQKSDLERTARRTKSSDMLQILALVSKMDKETELVEIERGEELPGMKNLREKVQLPREKLREQLYSDQRRRFMEHYIYRIEGDTATRYSGVENKIFILNSIVLDGSWKIPFKSDPDDALRPFYTNGTNEMIRYSKAKGVFKIAELSDLNCRVVELDLAGNRFSLLIFLPLQKNGISELQHNLSKSSLKNVVEQLYEEKITVFLPPLPRLTTLSTANQWLKAEHLFEPGSDFSGMAPGLFISRFAQSAQLYITSADASAHSSTGSYVSGRAMPQVDFAIDRPFIFNLVDKTEGVTMFTGTISKPEIKPWEKL